MAQNVSRTTTYADTTPGVAVHDVDVAATRAVGQLRRISWGSVIAGLSIAVVVQIALYMLGVAIGALTINPVTEQAPLEGLGTAFIIWEASSTLIALFVGGWVAGRLSGIPSQLDGTLHGLIVWSTSVIVSLVLFSTTVGSLVNGTVNLLGQTANATASLVDTVAPEAADAVQAVADNTPLTLSPEQISQEVVALIEEETGTELEITDQEGFNQALVTFAQAAAQDGITAEEREALETSLAETTALEEAELEQAVATVETRVNELTTQVEQTVDEVQAQATVAAENAAEVIAAIAGALFASLVIGAFAAGLGGFVGAPEVTAEMEVAR